MNTNLLFGSPEELFTISPTHHEIIKDIKKLKEFIKWLPELNHEETYYIMLLGRKKYHESANNGVTQIERITINSKEKIIPSIKRLEGSIGCYLNTSGDPLHNDALALYIFISPRNTKKAKQLLLEKLVQILPNNDKRDPLNLSLTAIQKAKVKTGLVEFDFDTTNSIATYISLFNEILNPHYYNIIITKGGFHLIVNTNKQFNKDPLWYSKIMKFKECEKSEDMMLPVIGCTQGGFTPHFYKG